MSNAAIMNDINDIIARIFQINPESLQAYIDSRKEKARRRVQSNNARYDAAIARITDVQACIIERMEAEGYRMQNRIHINKATGNIAVMLVKSVWNSAKGRVSPKLVMLYPDGSRNETFEKSITIRQQF